MADYYKTEFWNKSKEPWPIREKGKLVMVVQPGEKVCIESWKATITFSRYSHITLNADGTMTLQESAAWINPWKEFPATIELVNIDGSSEESIPCLLPNEAVTGPGAYLHAPRGWPVLFPLNIRDKLCRWSKIIWKKRPVKVPSPNNPKYYTVVERVEVERVTRDKEEWRRIQKKIKDEETDIAAKKLDKAIRSHPTT